MAIDDRQVVVFADAQPGLAYLVRNRLAEAGIDCFIENESLPYGANELLPAVIGPRIVVSEADAPAAVKIVAEFRREPQEMAAAATNQPMAADNRKGTSSPGQLVDVATLTGPACPACGRARMIECPYCHTAGTDFPRGDQPVATAKDSDKELLICPTCDEPFAPRDYRRCEWCGHDFGAGIEIEPQKVAEYLNDRVVVAVVAAAAILLVIFAYFGSILK